MKDATLGIVAFLIYLALALIIDGLIFGQPVH